MSSSRWTKFLPLKNSAVSSAITEAENFKWHYIGEAKDSLLKELTQLYWAGVENELETVLVALRAWQKHDQVDFEEETDGFIHGFDTFIDQISKESRDFADKVEQLKEKQTAVAAENYVQALAQSAEVAVMEHRSVHLKREIRDAVADCGPDQSAPRRRARLLLQSLGLLDIEKLVEHRPPVDGLSFWNRPAVPQLKLETFSQSGIPVLDSMRCTHCRTIIGGSMYCRTTAGKDKLPAVSDDVCEECYLKHFLENPGSERFVKRYKHCILNDIINPRVSRRICLCDEVPHRDSQGMSLPLFPVSKDDNHRTASGPGAIECGLLKLGAIIAEAKYNGMRRVTTRKNPKKNRTVGKKEEDGEPEQTKLKGTERLKTVTQESRQAPDRDAATGTAVAVEEAEADKDIPYYLRKYAEKYPFGNVHMALRIGPIVIENGVKYTEGNGALITLRDPPALQPRTYTERSRALALSEGPTRHLWWQDRPRKRIKRYKSIMKQVIGTPFTELLDKSIEDQIIDNLLRGSKHAFDDEGLSSHDRRKWVTKLLELSLGMLKELIGRQLSVYLKSLISGLLDPATKLAWSPFTNNCQNFCDSLLDLETFGALVPDPSRRLLGSQLYLMSFVCRPAGYVRPKIKSKLDVPNGLTEEYLLRFRFGRHDDADIIDSLHEYWHDWGAFGTHLYRYQDLFPWDCTEAFGRYPITCGDCNLSKHLWAFPFDSWSIISLHLTRDRFHYPSPDNTQPGITSDADWVKNRLLVLMAQEKLTIAAVAMARSSTFRERTSWLLKQRDPALDRLKLGGIHRAQPFSHYYEQGKYQHYFIASWAHLKLQDQIARYELLRDGRVKLPDVEFAPRLYNGESLSDILKYAALGGAIADAGFSGGPGHGDSGGAAGNCSSACGNSACAAGNGGDGGGCAGGGCAGGGCAGGGCAGG